MKPTVYIETTIPSYYWDQRTETTPDIARTRQWWDEERNRFQCYISPVVLEELQSDSYPNQQKCIDLVKDLPSLRLVPEIRDIADVYQKRSLMPKSPIRDALHLALASFYRMDYLLTWNCKHLANATKVHHFETLNQGMGLSVPLLTTPYMLQLWE